jgi:hypothetical protein
MAEALPDDLNLVVHRARVGGASAVLCVEVVGNVGYLFFLEGEVVHASTLELEGEPAVVAILTWREVRLSWCERRWPRERSVLRDWNQLAAAAQAPAPAAPTPSPVAAIVSAKVEPEVREPPALAHASEVHFPSSLGLRQVLGRAEFKNALRLAAGGHVTDSRGSVAHLKPILRSTVTLGDLLGATLGLGPLIGAEASAPGFHRLVARSAEDASVAETSGGNALQLVRAFLKL